MEKTMRALVKDRPEVGLSMKRVEIPRVNRGEVKIKIQMVPRTEAQETDRR